MATSNEQRVATRLGESALTGVRGAAVRAVAHPVAKRTRWTDEQVRTVLGLLLVAYSLYRVLRPVVRAARERP
jgi:hypothetical protein